MALQNQVSSGEAKHWAGCTLNNYNNVDLARFELIKPNVDYFVYGKEIGESGTPHLQFMVSFKAKKKFNSVKKMFPGAHLEIKSPKSSMLEASDYCKKDGDFVEWGTLPKDQKTAGLKAIADKYADTLAKAKVNNIAEITPEHQLRYYKTIKQIAHDNKVAPADLTWKEGAPPNLWIYGPTRTGKSWRARQICGTDRYLKNAANKWWDKYDGQKNVLIEDIDLTHSYQGFYLKIWADKYAFPVEIKTSGDLIRPQVIVVTSNYKIEEIFPDPSIHLPLLERFKVIHMEHRWDASLSQKLTGKLPATNKRKSRITEGQRPLKRPALFRQNASGALVTNKVRQALITEKVSLPEVINLADTISYSSAEEQEMLVQKPKEVDVMGSNYDNCLICGDLEPLTKGVCVYCVEIEGDTSNFEDPDGYSDLEKSEESVDSLDW